MAPQAFSTEGNCFPAALGTLYCNKSVNLIGSPNIYYSRILTKIRSANENPHFITNWPIIDVRLEKKIVIINSTDEKITQFWELCNFKITRRRKKGISECLIKVIYWNFLGHKTSRLAVKIAWTIDSRWNTTSRVGKILGKLSANSGWSFK